MELSLILINKTLSLFLIMLMGGVLVRTGLIKASESRSISVVTLYLIVPCVILNAFQVDCTAEVQSGLILALIAGLVLQLAYIPLVDLLAKPFHLDPLERVAAIYSNSGNLVVPLVTAILGQEYVIYSSAYLSIQLFLLWSHAKSTLCGEKKIDLKKILGNINMISILVGILLFATGFRLPGFVGDAVSSMSVMVGPAAMLVTGMLIGGMDLKRLLSYKRLPLVCFIRLIFIPIITILFLKYSGLARLAPDGDKILLITLLATITPMASSITQMAQIYDRDADYASAINVATTLLCIVTMPLMVFLYQML